MVREDKIHCESIFDEVVRGAMRVT